MNMIYINYASASWKKGITVKDTYYYLGTERPYPYHYSYPPLISKQTSPPTGYEVAFINYLGRHGSRYLTSNDDINLVLSFLKESANENKITEKGIWLYNQLISYQNFLSPNYGLLAPLGYTQLQEIAWRMYQRYSKVFHNNKKVVAVSTDIPRAIESMEAFLSILNKLIDPKNITMNVNGDVDPILRFFDLNEAYLQYKEDAPWKQCLQEYVNRAAYDIPVLSQYNSGLLASTEVTQSTATALYNIFCNLYNVDYPNFLQDDFNYEELLYYWENENAHQYLEKGPSLPGVTLPIDIAFPLLQDFLTTSDEALNNNQLAAFLRFAHAETIIPFAGILNILNASVQVASCSQIAEIWHDYRISPMAANIQWVFYQKTLGPVLLKVLYNEEEIRLPLSTDIPPYYKWEDVRVYYSKILNSLPIPESPNLIDQVKYFK